jgi:hypothetical protein
MHENPRRLVFSEIRLPKLRASRKLGFLPKQASGVPPAAYLATFSHTLYRRCRRRPCFRVRPVRFLHPPNNPRRCWGLVVQEMGGGVGSPEVSSSVDGRSGFGTSGSGRSGLGYPGFNLKEIANAVYVRVSKRPDHKTIRHILVEEPIPLRFVRRYSLQILSVLHKN